MKILKIALISLITLAAGILLTYLIINVFLKKNNYIMIKTAYKTGTIYNVGAPVTANVIAIHVQIGDQVEKDQILVGLDNSEILKKLELAKDELLHLQNSLQEKTISYNDLVKVIEMQKRRYDVLAEINDIDLKERVEREMLKSGIVLNGGNSIDSINELKIRIQSLKNQITIQEKNIATLEEEVSNSVIRSPISGIVDELLINPGEVVQVGKNVLTIIDPRSEWVEAFLNEKYLAQIKIGSQVNLKFSSYPRKVFRGQVSYIGRVEDNLSKLSKHELRTNDHLFGQKANFERYIKIRISFENQDYNLPNGISATVIIKRQKEARKL